MEKEERLIFPMLVEKKGEYIYCQVSTLMHNHDCHSDTLEKIKNMTDNFTAPAGTSVKWIDFYAKLKEFNDDLLEHIRLENDIVFSGNR